MRFLQTPRDRAGFLILVLASAIVFAVWPFFSGLLGAAVLYVVFVRPFRWLARILPHGLAAAIILIAALFLIALPLTWVAGLLIQEAPGALRSVQTSSLFARLAELRIGSLDVGSEIAKASGTIVSWLSAQAFGFVGSATSAILNLVIAFFGFYYMLRSERHIWGAIRGYIPFSHKTADALRDRFVSVTEATLLGTALTSIVQGTLVGVGFWMVALPDPLFWGTVTAFASILPVLGSSLVWLPAIIVLVAQGRNGAALIMAVIGAGIASNIDNLIRPIVYRRVSNIHPMITLIGAFAGVKYFGLVGLLLGPLAIAYLFELLHFYREEYSVSEAAPIPPAVPISYASLSS